jgi:hypothetical protein
MVKAFDGPRWSADAVLHIYLMARARTLEKSSRILPLVNHILDLLPKARYALLTACHGKQPQLTFFLFNTANFGELLAPNRQRTVIASLGAMPSTCLIPRLPLIVHPLRLTLSLFPTPSTPLGQVHNSPPSTPQQLAPTPHSRRLSLSSQLSTTRP